MRLLALQRRNKKAALIEGGFPLLHHLSRPAGGRLWSNNSDRNNITTINDALSEESVTYGYDPLDRLTTPLAT